MTAAQEIRAVGATDREKLIAIPTLLGGEPKIYASSVVFARRRYYTNAAGEITSIVTYSAVKNER